MATRGSLLRAAGDLYDAFAVVDRNFYITIEDGKVLLSLDNESWSPKLQVWPEDDE